MSHQTFEAILEDIENNTVLPIAQVNPMFMFRLVSFNPKTNKQIAKSTLLIYRGEIKLAPLDI